MVGTLDLWCSCRVASPVTSLTAQEFMGLGGGLENVDNPLNSDNFFDSDYLVNSDYLVDSERPLPRNSLSSPFSRATASRLFPS